MAKRKYPRSDTTAVVNRAIRETQTHIESLEFAKQSRLPEELADPIVGHATREIIKQMNIVRDQYGFDDVED